MAVYTEDFAGALADLTTPWVQGSTVIGFTLQRDGSGHGQSAFGSDHDCISYYNNTIGADQYSQIVPQFTGPGTGHGYIYLFLRASGGAGWYLSGSGQAFYFFWSDGGSDTQVLYGLNGNTGLVSIDTANAFTFNSGDLIKFQVIGTTLQVFKNGTPITWTTSGTTSVSDSHVSSGFPGVGLSVTTISTQQIDNWEGGDAGTTAVDALEWKPRSQQVALAHNYSPIIIPVN